MYRIYYIKKNYMFRHLTLAIFRLGNEKKKLSVCNSDEFRGWQIGRSLEARLCCVVYPALLPLMRTPRLPVVDWTYAPADLNTRPFRRKTKSCFCACAITFQLASTMRCCMQAGRNKTACAERNHSAIYTTHYANSPVQQHWALNASCVLSFFLSFFLSPTSSTYSLQAYMVTAAPDRTHTPHLGTGLLWTSDQLNTGASSKQHTTLTTDIHAPGGIRTRSSSKRASAIWRLRPRGHRDRLECFLVNEMPHSRLVCPTSLPGSRPECTSIGHAPKHLATLSTLRGFGHWCWLVDDPLSYHVITSLATVCLQPSAFVSDLQFVSAMGNRPLRPPDLCARSAPVSIQITYVPA